MFKQLPRGSAFHDPAVFHENHLTGHIYDVEVSQAIAEKLGVTPVFVEGEFNGLLAGLEARRYDIMVNIFSLFLFSHTRDSLQKRPGPLLTRVFKQLPRG